MTEKFTKNKYPNAAGDALPALQETELVIFDWDGTLVDSRQVIVDTMRASLEEVGLPVLPDRELQQVIGLGLREAISALVPDADARTHDLLRETYGRRFKSYGATDMPFFPGAEQGLQWLVRQGRSLAVATGKSRQGLDRMLREWRLEGFFAATRCADETCSKPDPRMIHELLESTGARPEQAVLVGDTAFDMEMAHRAGISAMAVTYGVHDTERLGALSPHAWADSFGEVLAHLGCTDLESWPAEGYN
ncbi:HAD family hydrolase [Thiohalorhabdus sp. Cl-TMA]|uniref:HAD family hydrolase n=1 Tax=Thiohalorhabdus methylotrophus TaxID=3242694 RepID=A0ABV4TXP3_9GAMM